MLVFKREQQVFDFSGVRIGGQPGQHPTVLVGGLFFKGQPIVESTKDGTFNKEMAREWVQTGVDMVNRTGHPLIIQAFGRTPLAMEKHLSWLSEAFDGPFMFESTSADARVRAIEYCCETGLAERAIYNSINMSMKEDEKALLRESSIDKAVVLGWAPRATSLVDRMAVIEKMVAEAEQLGITRLMVDPATLPVGAGYGLEYRTLLAIKSQLGLPTCLGPHNAPSAWRFIREPGFDDEGTHLAAVVAATVNAQVYACDCIMYGSMLRTKQVFAAVALTGNAIASAAAETNEALGLDRELFDPPTFE
ncbi:MAG: hypothetical protein HXY34_11980 [Candidatus Thorarchaeota archaeon]|nr:hypothetical protein [Candidatus Thorarchaeota archaeon]